MPQTEVAHFVEAARQHVLEEAAHELLAAEAADTAAAGLAVAVVLDADPRIVEVDDAGVGDGDAEDSDRARRAPVAQPGRATGVGAPSRPTTPTAQVSSPGSVGQAMAAGPDDPTLDPTRPDLEGKIPREVVEARKAAMRKTLAERSGR